MAADLCDEVDRLRSVMRKAAEHLWDDRDPLTAWADLLTALGDDPKEALTLAAGDDA